MFLGTNSRNDDGAAGSNRNASNVLILHHYLFYPLFLPLCYEELSIWTTREYSKPLLIPQFVQYRRFDIRGKLFQPTGYLRHS